jgi:hypothetical protein
MEWRRRRSAMRSAIVQQHLALLCVCAAACTVHQSADTRRRSRPQCDLTSDSSRELLPPRRETPTFWNWIGQALSSLKSHDAETVTWKKSSKMRT